MWKVADVKSELEATELLLKTRPDIEKIKSGLVTQLKHKLLNMTEIQAAGLVELYNLFQSSSLPADVRNEMLDVLDNRAAAGHNCETSAGKLCLVPQTLTALQHYLTADDISRCEKGSMWAGTEVLASRLRKLGVVSMKECTKKVSIAILVHFEVERTNTIPPGDSVYALAEHMLQALKVSSTTVPADAKSLRRYPASPSQLDAKHFAASYGAEVPISRDFPRLAQIMVNHSPVRSSSNLVSEGAKTAKVRKASCLVCIVHSCI